MDRSMLMALTVVLMLGLVSLLAVGWFARRRRQAGVTAPNAVPSDTGEPVGSFRGKYVATTTADDPFDRIAVHGLGFRGPVTVAVSELGISVAIAGVNDFWIASSEVREFRRASWTIDRAVEKDGMHVIGWNLGEREVDSYFLMDSPVEFSAALDALSRKQTA